MRAASAVAPPTPLWQHQGPLVFARGAVAGGTLPVVAAPYVTATPVTASHVASKELTPAGASISHLVSDNPHWDASQSRPLWQSMAHIPSAPSAAQCHGAGRDISQGGDNSNGVLRRVRSVGNGVAHAALGRSDSKQATTHTPRLRHTFLSPTTPQETQGPMPVPGVREASPAAERALAELRAQVGSLRQDLRGVRSSLDQELQQPTKSSASKSASHKILPTDDPDGRSVPREDLLREEACHADQEVFRFAQLNSRSRNESSPVVGSRSPSPESSHRSSLGPKSSVGSMLIRSQSEFGAGFKSTSGMGGPTMGSDHSNMRKRLMGSRGPQSPSRGISPAPSSQGSITDLHSPLRAPLRASERVPGAHRIRSSSDFSKVSSTAPSLPESGQSSRQSSPRQGRDFVDKDLHARLSRALKSRSPEARRAYSKEAPQRPTAGHEVNGRAIALALAARRFQSPSSVASSVSAVLATRAVDRLSPPPKQRPPFSARAHRGSGVGGGACPSSPSATRDLPAQVRGSFARDSPITSGSISDRPMPSPRLPFPVSPVVGAVAGSSALSPRTRRSNAEQTKSMVALSSPGGNADLARTGTAWRERQQSLLRKLGRENLRPPVRTSDEGQSAAWHRPGAWTPTAMHWSPTRASRTPR